MSIFLLDYLTRILRHRIARYTAAAREEATMIACINIAEAARAHSHGITLRVEELLRIDTDPGRIREILDAIRHSMEQMRLLDAMLWKAGLHHNSLEESFQILRPMVLGALRRHMTGTEDASLQTCFDQAFPS